MSWLFSQALVEEYSEDTFSDGEQCAPLSLTRMPRVYLCSDKMMGFCRRSPFGMTFGLSTEQSGEELLTWYLAGFHAKTLAAQEMAQESEVNGQAYGQKWRGSLAKYDPATHSLKTAQCSLFEDLTESSAILPRWGSMRNGELFQQPIPALCTNVNESGLWPTPSAHKNTESGELVDKSGDPWDGIGKPHSKTTGKQVQTALADAIKARQMWATPTTMDKLPPKSAEALEREATVARPGRSKPANLRDQVSNMHRWPTPQASDNRDRGNLSSVSVQNRIQKGKQIMLSMSVSTENGRLNPMWVEWLMGWPLGWTDLQPLAMDKFHEWQQQHSISYKGEQHEQTT